MKPLIVVSSLTLIIGFCLGAISMIVLRPERQTEIANARTAAQVPAAQEPAPKPLPKAAPDDKRYPGSILVEPPKEIPAADVELIRNYLRKETDSGVWEEIEWTKADVAPSVKGDRDDQGKYLRVEIPGGYAVKHSYRTSTRFGGIAKQTVTLVVRSDKLLIGPDAFDTSEIKREDYP